MSDTENLVNEEIKEHTNDLNEWIADVEKIKTTQARQDVLNRFMRDCRTLIADLNEKDTPSSADLVDFSDRRNSLEIQYLNITSDK